MAVIKTERNFVCAYEPQDGDCFVETWLGGEELDGSAKRWLFTQSIDQYRAAVDWAVGIADQMVHPLEVVPITGAEYLRCNRDAMEKTLMGMSDQERGELRQWAIKACVEILRDCDDPAVRAEAYDALVQMKVVRP
jgi:hypothetical protein